MKFLIAYKGIHIFIVNVMAKKLRWSLNLLHATAVRIRLPTCVSWWDVLQHEEDWTRKKAREKTSADDHSIECSTMIANDDGDGIGNEGNEWLQNIGDLGSISFSEYKLFIFIRILVGRCYCFHFVALRGFNVCLFFPMFV